MIVSHKAIRSSYIVLFGVIWSIILYRAISIPMLSDEVYTFFRYIRDGQLNPFSAHLDANNHTLNTFFSHLFYKSLGDFPLVLRLANVLSFGLYAFFCWKVFLQFRSRFLGSLWLLMMMLSIYVIEYFALTRGYGLATAFLLASIFYLIKIQKSQELRHYIGLWLFSSLALWSNLGMMIVVLILGVLSLFSLYHHKLLLKKRGIKFIIFFLLISVIPVLKAMSLALLLKEQNLLYYGYLDGLFEKTFAFIFIENFGGVVLGYLTAAITLMLFIVALFYGFKSRNFKLQDHFVSILFFGTISGLLALHLILDVMYPAGRTAIYLYFILFVSAYYLLDRYPSQIGNYLAVIPVLLIVGSFVMKANVSYVTNWRHEALPKEISDYLNELVDESAIITGEKWFVDSHEFDAYISNSDENRSFVTEFEDFSDYRITNAKLDNRPVVGFDTLIYDSYSYTTIMKNQKNIKWNPLDTVYTMGFSGEFEFFEFEAIDISGEGYSEYRLDFEFDLKSSCSRHNFQMMAGLFNQDNELLNYTAIDLKRFHRNYFDWTSIKQSRLISEVPKEATILKLYFWNIDERSAQMKNVRISRSVLSH